MMKIGTRGSKLATTQAGHVRDWINGHGFNTELHIVTTAGDVNMAPVERIGVGVFTTALREALANGECDIAVHSFKDLPTAPDERFELIVPEREDSREALIARDGMTLADLPEGARVGTSAPRRISQLKAMRPDLDIRPLRGNIETRMGKIDSGELDAVILAYAGLVRNGYGDKATQVFSIDEFMPAPAQGALAVEARIADASATDASADSASAIDAIRSVQNKADQLAATAERTVLSRLEAGCTAPVGATSRIQETLEGTEMTVTGGVFALDGSKQLIESATGPLDQAIELGEQVSKALYDAGAAFIISAT